MREHNSQVRLLNSLYYMLMQQQLVFFLRAWQCDVNSNPHTNSTQMCPADSLDMPQDPVPQPKPTRELTTNLTHTSISPQHTIFQGCKKRAAQPTTCKLVKAAVQRGGSACRH